MADSKQINTVTGISLSQEQKIFVNTALSGENVLVDACIGSGKTTAIQYLCQKIPSQKRILYLTYNKLLKLDAKSKIRRKNVTVTNYHGFAFKELKRLNIKCGISDSIQIFLQNKPVIEAYDVLIIDEYQDIEKELASLLEYIKESSPQIQIVAVGDMEQKIYDKTTLNVREFIHVFLGQYIELEFTQCFRLSEDLAAMLGRVWHKKIIGVNKQCVVEKLGFNEAVNFLAQQNTGEVLCLGARTGKLSKALNKLERDYPEKFNKSTVYASISDNDKVQNRVSPGKNTAIFTTFDASKGLERKICVLFDFTESYWEVRRRKPQQSYEILRNIFCVAASRGKNHIVFVETDEAMLTEATLSEKLEDEEQFESVDISSMFDFKYKEDIEDCFQLLECEQLQTQDRSVIEIQSTDGMIDLSPCIGKYQEAVFFEGHSIDTDIDFYYIMHPDKQNVFTEEKRAAPLENKILFETSLQTNQERYNRQVQIPFVNDSQKDAIIKRLASVFNPQEEVQVRCQIDFAGDKNGNRLFTADGIADVVKDDVVYELKFVSELTHENFLQCACYMVALEKDVGILWNTRSNIKYKIVITDREAFLDKVTYTITKHRVKKYRRPSPLLTEKRPPC